MYQGFFHKSLLLFILQSADFLEYGTPPENVAAYVDTARQLVAY
jgi:hypothetical protein